MFRIFLIFTIFNILFCQECDVIIDDMKFHGNCKGVLKHGRFIAKDSNNVISWEIHYKNDILHGVFIQYYPSAQIKMKGHYKNGILNGKFEQINIDKTKILAHFKHGQLHGKMYKYDSNNDKIQELKFYYGKLVSQKYF